jgi:hypothetical protein
MTKRERLRFPERRASVLLGLALIMVLARALDAQDPAKGPEYVVGEAISVDADARRLTLKSDTGDSVLVMVPEGASLLRARPGATSLAEATRLTLSEIAAGDRVMARGTPSPGQSALQARQLVVMTRDDIGRKQDTDRAEWRQRGVMGVVAAIDPARGEITLKVGRAAEATTLTISTTGRPVAFRRYAPDSVSFSEARPSALGELQIGDELRALGERGPDGGTFDAEQIVSGSFRVVLGTITALDVAHGSLLMRDEESRQSVTVTVGPDARLRRLLPELVASLSHRRASEGDPADSRRARGAPDPGAGPEDLLNRLPPTTLADLKLGERILVSSTKGNVF